MTAAIVITAGRSGGDFDAFIDHMGAPRDFGFDRHNAKHVYLVEGRGGTGLTVDMITDGFGTNEVMLRAADGHMLVDVVNLKIGYNMMRPKIFADPALDGIMDSVQSASFNGMAYDLRFVGNRGDDLFTGNKGADTLTGAAGNDVLAGGAGNDSIMGGAGDDTLIGGNGADLLKGNAGADVFVFGSALAGKDDRIADFHADQGDRIDLRGFGAIPGTLDLDAFTLIDGPDFGHHAGELRLVITGKTVIEGDLDGDGNADFAITLAHVTQLDATAFLFA